MQQKPSYELSGKLAEETNRVRGENSIILLVVSCFLKPYAVINL